MGAFDNFVKNVGSKGSVQIGVIATSSVNLASIPEIERHRLSLTVLRSRWGRSTAEDRAEFINAINNEIDHIDKTINYLKEGNTFPGGFKGFVTFPDPGEGTHQILNSIKSYAKRLQRRDQILGVSVKLFLGRTRDDNNTIIPSMSYGPPLVRLKWIPTA